MQMLYKTGEGIVFEVMGVVVNGSAMSRLCDSFSIVPKCPAQRSSPPIIVPDLVAPR